MSEIDVKTIEGWKQHLVDYYNKNTPNEINLIFAVIQSMQGKISELKGDVREICKEVI